MTDRPSNKTPAVEEARVEPSEPAVRELTEEQKAAEIAEKQKITDATHAEMWAALDGKSPFDWPDDARNLFQSGCTCSLWGRSVVDMNPDQRILFVAYVDTIASDLLAQCKGLSMAIEQVGAAKRGRKNPFGRRKK